LGIAAQLEVGGLPQTPLQYRLLGAKVVLLFVEDHTLRAVDHFVGDLFAAMGIQSVKAASTVCLLMGHQEMEHCRQLN